MLRIRKLGNEATKAVRETCSDASPTRRKVTSVLHSVRTAMLLSAWCHPWRSQRSTGYSGPDSRVTSDGDIRDGMEWVSATHVAGQRKVCTDPNIELVAIETG